ncbi:MAG: DUF3520 domain-containing protein [Alphaproteobacteria bacterium]|nr:DUF3520 domain-containing protein [Alphaproteobacteria bacterium]
MRAQAEMQRAPALSNEGMAGKPQQQGATLRMDDSLAAAPAEKERGEKDKGFARKRDKAVAQNAVEAKKSESVMMKAMPSASMPAPAKEPSLAGGAPAPMQVMPAPGVAMPVSPPVVVERYRQPYYQQAGRDAFPDYKDNGVMEVASDPVSTFSIDVDTSSYSFLRRSINEGHLPPRGAVRLEEMINYFHYNYKVPEEGADPFLPNVAVFDCPWRKGDKIVDIGIKGYEPAERPKSNIVFLIDTSGSMNSPDKLPLLVSSFKLMLDSLKPDDTVGIVTYAGHAGVALEPTPASDKVKILSVLDNLYASGSTAGAQGIQSAYQLAEQAFIKGGNNRILLATDGDFNVGVSSQSGLKDLITRERDKGIYLSVLGFGTGNYQDTTMQTLAQNGNGNASYIDNLSEARKVLVDEASSTLFTIAKDVKIQVEFNPKTVQEYRLLGYETRHLNREDFNNDKIDAGEVGAGHAVTAIYEITPVGAQPLVDKLRYGGEAAQKQRPEADADDEKAGNVSGEYAFLKIRYKKPDADTSTLMTRPITPSDERPFAETSDDVRFATAVAGFGQLLRGSNYIGNLSYDQIIEMASHAKGADEDGYRAEFVNLVKLAKSEAGATTGPAEGGGDGDEPVEPGPVPMIQK